MLELTYSPVVRPLPGLTLDFGVEPTFGEKAHLNAGHDPCRVADHLLQVVLGVHEHVVHVGAGLLTHLLASLVGRIDDEIPGRCAQLGPASIFDEFIVGAGSSENGHGISCHEITAQLGRDNLFQVEHGIKLYNINTITTLSQLTSPLCAFFRYS